MRGILGEIALLNRVVGAFVCDASGELLAAEPSDLAGARDAARVGRTVAGAVSDLGGSDATAPLEVELCFENGRLLLRPTGPEATLGVVCEPNVDTAFVWAKVAEAASAIAGTLGVVRAQRR